MMRFHAILFNIVEQCNIRCSHCGYADSLRQTRVTEQELVDWVSQAVEYGIPQVIFTGGEPFTQVALLKRGIEAVYERGGTSGVFTNSLWGDTVDAARTMLESLPGLTHLYLSCDIYHLEFVPAQYLRNIIQAARELSIPTVIICVTYTSDQDKEKITALFAEESDYVHFYYGRVIPSDYVQARVPDAYEHMHELRPENFSSQCFLHTPLVNPNGTVSACHIGKVETHGDLSSSPYYLGSLKQEPLNAIFDRAEDNALYQLLRTCGPKVVVDAALSSDIREELQGQSFAGDCHMCFEVLPRTEVLTQVRKQAAEVSTTNAVFLKRIMLLHDAV